MKTIEALKILNKETPASVYLVGGYVRDMLRGVQNDDLDVVVTGMPIFKIRRFLSKFGKVKEVTLAQTNEHVSVNILLFRGKSDNIDAQISLPRRGKHQVPDSHNTLRNDVKFRDFKMNSIYLPVDYRGRKDIIDYVEGRKDIATRTISSNGSPNERIKESPIRMMRAVSLASRTGYRIDKALMTAITANAQLISKCPAEAVRKEFNKIVMSKKPSRYIEILLKAGLLEIIAPEIYNCVGVAQDKKFHKFDVFKHLVYTCNACPKDLIIRLAGLLHDVGKPATRKETSNGDRRITFHKHEVVSTKLAKAFMRRMKYDNDTAKAVVHLVQYHMYHYTREWTDAAVRKFIRRVSISSEYMTEDNISEFPLFKLRASERKGNGLKKVGVTERQKDFEKRILSLYKESTGLEVKDLAINGHILMETFNLGPGEQIGEILKFLLERVLEQPKLNTKLDLLKLATEYIFNKREG